MNASKLVMSTLLRLYRPIALWFLAVLTVVLVGVDVVTRIGSELEVFGGLWTLITSSATRYWILVVGILVTTMQLRVYVANGITRRDFTRGAAAFGLIVAVAFTVVVLIGHAVESTVVATAVSGDHVALSAARELDRLGRVLPTLLAYGVSGWLIGIGYYRFHPLAGTLLIAPAVVPMVVTTWLLGAEDFGPFNDAPLPYAVGLPIVLAVVAIAFLLVRRLLSDVAIRRAGTT
jgi:hypothetical protein